MLNLLWNWMVKPGLLILLLMQFMKALFLKKNQVFIQEETSSEILTCFPNSFSLDLASLSYLLFIPLLAILIQVIWKRTRFILPFLRFYYALMVVFVLAINWIDMNMFVHWKAKLSAKALSYLNTPDMVIATAGKELALVFFILVITGFLIFFYFFKFFIDKVDLSQKRSWLTPIYFFVVLGLLILGLRGGLREIPINQSDAYYSNNHVLNVAGVNSIWNIGNVLFQNQNTLKNNPYRLLEDQKAQEIFESITSIPKDTTIQLLNTQTPNIIYIALEGVNANCINEYNSGNNFMPEVSKIIEEGYMFKRMYASGMRTDQGLVAVLSGFPALPLHTIGAQPEKFQHLPSLPLALKEKSYTNKFFFAGEPEFGSFKAYLVHNGFEKVYSLDDFPKEQQTQDLGAPDEFLFDKFLEDMENPQEPFFSLMLTQTTHEPFDMPFNEDEEDDARKYINTVKYVDGLIGEWYEACKDMPWFENTLFIISSDHSHTFPARYWYTDRNRYQIPFIMFGPALKDEFKGEVNMRLMNQTDIPYSLAKQLDLPSEDYQFSKDMMNPYSPLHTSFISIHGHTWIDKQGDCFINYDMNNQELMENHDLNSCNLKNAAYFQVVFNTYINY
ncbi:MAG: phosphoglycerol transferase MdoB-like AlkP superfamily enzyme [Chitinophagales bacterium]|jgi:phosphoglycerol transferase MdoB-like AlkP superfamily enzyme